MSNAITNSNKAAQDAAKQTVKNMGAMANNAFVQSTQVISDKLNDFGLPVEALVSKREKAMKWVSDNKFRVLGGVFVSLIVIFYFVALYNRIDRYLSRMEIYTSSPVNLISDSKIINANTNYILADFWIASSYKSYLPCTNYFDYASIDAITACLKSGARLIDLDIFNSGIFDACPEPVVCNGDEVGNWHYTTELSFDKVIKELAQTAFNPQILQNTKDPLFLSLNFKTWGNKATINKAASILKNYFSDQQRLLSIANSEYNYQGRRSGVNGKNIAKEPIKNLFGKVIVICSGKILGTDMDELCNIYTVDPSIPENKRYEYDISTKTYRNPADGSAIKEHDFQMKSLTSKQLLNYSFSEAKPLKNSNRGVTGTPSLTRIIPSQTTRTKENYNCWIPFYYGCTFICMNYTEPTDFMKSYAERFRECSLLLKPYRLRYHQSCIQSAQPQNSRLSFSTKTKLISTGYYMDY